MKKEQAVFDSNFCHVSYRQKDGIVLLRWKQFCCFEEYRSPVRFALKLLEEHAGVPFVIDTRNGFEDEKADVEWGFAHFIPALAAAGCKMVIFIMDTVTVLEGEIDLWTQEFQKYFQVEKVGSYSHALIRIKEHVPKESNLVPE